MKAIIYVRVSTKRQADAGVSLEAQAAECGRWCDYHKHQAAAVYVERGLSGRRADNRPALQDALADLQRGDVLVVYSLSRLARSTVDAGRILAELESTGADFVSVSENLDTTSAAGRLIFNIMAALAEFESEQISERVSGAMQYLKSGGRRYCSPAIYGYKTVDGDLVPLAGEQKIIRRIQRQHAAGKSLSAIARELTDRGVATKRGGKRWYPSTVRAILQNDLHVAAA